MARGSHVGLHSFLGGYGRIRIVAQCAIRREFRHTVHQRQTAQNRRSRRRNTCGLARTGVNRQALAAAPRVAQVQHQDISVLSLEVAQVRRAGVPGVLMNVQQVAYERPARLNFKRPVVSGSPRRSDEVEGY